MLIETVKKRNVYKSQTGAILFATVDSVSVTGEEACVATLNALFSRLEKSLDSAARRFADGAPEGIYRLSASVTHNDDGEYISVTRTYTLRFPDGTARGRGFSDLVRIQDGKLLKRRKNVRKQRFIPSRNGKNITKND